MVGIKRYSEEFKREALRLQGTSGKRVVEVERELGLSHGLLRQWKGGFWVNRETDTLELNAVEQLKAESRWVKRELEVVQQERDILKKRWASSRRMCSGEICSRKRLPRGISGVRVVCRTERCGERVLCMVESSSQSA